MRIFKITADYQFANPDMPVYYVEAKSDRDARRRFKNRLTWLTVYDCVEVTDAALEAEIRDNPSKYMIY